MLSAFVIRAQTFSGTLGQYPIMMAIPLDNAYAVNANYIYKKYLKSIDLRFDKKSNEITLQSIHWGGAKKSPEVFHLSLVNGQLQGYWQHGKTRLPVKLAPSAISIDDYVKQNLRIIVTGHKHYPFGTVDILKEVHSGESFYRLGTGFSQAARQATNPKLTQILRSHSETSLRCIESDFSAELSLVSPHYLSLHGFYSVYCMGAAHPSHGYLGYNFDLKRAKVLKKVSDRFNQVDYIALLKQLYPQYTQPNDDDECHYFADQTRWKYAQWYLTEQSVVIIPSFIHALGACEQAFILPYKIINAPH